MKNVLIACEESQRVCIAFRNRGFNAFSCDIIDCSGGHPEWHIKEDVTRILNPNKYGIQFFTEDKEYHELKRWDLIIAHPPCTYLTVAANKLYNVEKYGEKAVERLQKREDAIGFFLNFVYADCLHIAIENPIGVISSRYRKPDQIIQPYEYGHNVRKSTCLWLYGLPKLNPTNIVPFEEIHSKGKSGGYSGNSWVVRDENGKILPYGDKRVSIARSKTYEGIADAMAQQWGDYLVKIYQK
ncbi:MAG: hypothetical protein J6R32_08615 [Bacteroidales bacterium]|nr:hypothetical protein [Bacteroidales bacterium]